MVLGIFNQDAIKKSAIAFSFLFAIKFSIAGDNFYLIKKIRKIHKNSLIRLIRRLKLKV